MENQAVFAKDLVQGMDVEFSEGKYVTVQAVECYPDSTDIEFVFVKFLQMKSRLPMFPLQPFMVRVVHDPAAEIEQMRKDDGVNIGYDRVPDLEELIGNEM